MKKLILVALIVLLASCGGGGSQPSNVSLQSSDGSGGIQAANESVPQSLDEALAELDALETPEGVDSALFQELKNELAALLAAKAEQEGSGRVVSQAPSGDGNKVADLTLVDMTEGEYLLMWREINVGDYDNNGTVGIADITPIAMHYGEEATDPNSETGLIDGYDGNGTVDIADITGIAMNFGTSIAGYNVYVEGTLQPNQGVAGDLSVMRPADPGSERVSYRYTLMLGGLVNTTVTPADTGGAEGVESDPAVLGTGEAPAAPEDLSASASQAIGPGRILLTWTPNTEDDLKSYRLYRTDDAVAYEQIATIPSTTFPLMYTDDNDEALLAAGSEYTYYVTAVDEDGFQSESSNEAATTPYFPDPPTAPTPIDATSDDLPYSYCIQVSWGDSESDYLDGYEVWSKGPGETEFSLWTSAGVSTHTLLDSGLTGGETYTYTARAFDIFGQYSDFTGEASAVPTSYIPLEIYSVTTDQTTLQVGSGERANLVVDLSDPSADITWEATDGSFDGGDTGVAVTYAPPESGGAQHVAVTVTADDGTSQEIAGLELIITTLPRLPISGPVPAPDFSEESMLAPVAPYIPFHTYVDAQSVITLTMGYYG
jgi:hypothetical protein